MVRIYASGKEYECAEVSRIHFKMLIDETGQEYLLMYDFGHQYLFAVERGEGEWPNFTFKFTFIDEVRQILASKIR